MSCAPAPLIALSSSIIEHKKRHDGLVRRKSTCGVLLCVAGRKEVKNAKGKGCVGIECRVQVGVYMYTLFSLTYTFRTQMSWTVRYRSPFSALLGVNLALVEGERSGIRFDDA